jgi:hypothetical protein
MPGNLVFNMDIPIIRKNIPVFSEPYEGSIREYPMANMHNRIEDMDNPKLNVSIEGISMNNPMCSRSNPDLDMDYPEIIVNK